MNLFDTELLIVLYVGGFFIALYITVWLMTHL